MDQAGGFRDASGIRLAACAGMSAVCGLVRTKAWPVPPEEKKTTMKHADVPFVIDFHTHMLDEELRAICTSRNAITGFGKKQPPPSANLRKFLDPELQIADMEERGIDMHVVFTGPVHMSTWWADPQTAAKLTRRMNDIIAGWVARYPKRFVGTVTLPMQDVDLAIVEFTHGVEELGHKAVLLPTNVDG